MPKRAKAQVRGNILEVQSESPNSTSQIRIESQEWFTWLEENTSFAFRDGQDYFTARKEQIKGKGQYWYAYRRHGKKMRKKYLGKSPKLTFTFLKQKSIALHNPAEVQQNEVAPLLDKQQSSPGLSNNSLLLSTKFTPPGLPPDMVHRPRLFDQFSTPIICVTAPAGFGKTTFVIEWLQQQRVDYAWVSVDGTDNDPLTFWRYILTALEQELENQLPNGLILSDFQGTQKIRNMLVNMINVFQRFAKPFYLVLDDFHLINNTEIHTALLFLLEQRPPNLHFIFTSRTRLPLSLGNLRAKNQFRELFADDLRFTKLESEAYFSKKRDLPLSEKEITLLQEQTEGWITGMHLASLALRREKNISQYLQQLEISSPFLEEYYLDAILSQESEPVQDFLLQISILRHFNSNLCNAVTDRTDGPEMLIYLEQENLFISRQPNRQGWHRLHTMFAEALSATLTSRYPDLRPVLHHRAAVWFQDQGSLEDAVRHYLAAQNWEQAANLIQELAPKLIVRGEVYRLKRWLEHLPESILQTHTPLYLTYARVNEKSLAEIVQWLENVRMDQNDYTGASQVAFENPERLINFFAAADRDLSYNQTTTSETYQTLWQEIDLMLLSLRHWMEGDWQAARESLEQATSLSFANNHRYIALQTAGMLVMQHMNQGHLRAGERIIQQVRENFQLGIDQLPMLMILALCYIRFEQNQLEFAQTLLQEGLTRGELQRHGEIFIRTQFLLARVLSALGRISEAEEVMQKVIDENIEQASPWISITELNAYQAHLWLLHDKLDLAESWLHRTGLTADDALTHENSYAQLIHAQILISQGKYEIADRLLKRMQIAFPAGLRTEPNLRLLLPHALVLFKLGNLNQAIQVLRKVLQMTQPEGYLRPYLAYGADMYTLLSLIKQQGQTSKPIQEYIKLLLRELKQLHGGIQNLGKGEINTLLLAASISQREREILGLIAAGYSNQTIADNLFITLNTVKSHLRRIYEKLDVSNRTQAVIKAREVNLL